MGEISVRLRKILPASLVDEVDRRLSLGGRLEELRLRRNRQAFLTVERRNVPLAYFSDGETLDRVAMALCDGSLYAYRDSIAQGYLSLPDGVRVGICGRASVERETILGVYDIASLNFRFPSAVTIAEDPVCRWLRESKGEGGSLIYSPPGVGKTTLLRCVANRLAGGREPMRVAVIDTRGELGFSLDGRGLCVDILTGYPRALGVEIATRTMNAQVILCDEIGEEREAEAILSAQNCGVPFIASAHGSDLLGLLRRRGIRRLHEARVFGLYVGLRRRAGGGDFQYTVTEWEDADDALQAVGSHSRDA